MLPLPSLLARSFSASMLSASASLPAGTDSNSSIASMMLTPHHSQAGAHADTYRIKTQPSLWHADTQRTKSNSSIADISTQHSQADWHLTLAMQD
jgi:hypothetical protein